jgi:4-carboxymuconolactone decarboxylase
MSDHQQMLQSLLDFAAAIAQDDGRPLDQAIAQLRKLDTDVAAVEELILQSVLMVGYPRALVAAAAWRGAVGVAAVQGTTDLDYADYPQWIARGAVTCEQIYGRNYPRLRESIRWLHPALETWMVTEGYGRTLSRPGLELGTRELCTVAQTAVLNTPRQLHSHILGALRSGATSGDVDMALSAARAFQSHAAAASAADLWARIRANWSFAS